LGANSGTKSPEKERKGSACQQPAVASLGLEWMSHLKEGNPDSRGKLMTVATVNGRVDRCMKAAITRK